MAHEDEETTETTSESRAAWDEVGAAFESLGLKLKLHFEESFADGAPEREAVENALAGLGNVIQKVVTPIRDALHDPAVRDDVDRIAQRLGAAVSETLEAAKAKVKPGDGCC